MAASEVAVAIVGGGAAGIAAARRLAEAGVDGLIIEARSRLGGRAWTVEESGAQIDLGCGWLHSADRNPWRAIAERQGRTIDKTLPPWRRASMAIVSQKAEHSAFVDALEEFRGRIAAFPEDAPDRPAADLLTPDGRWNALIDAVSTYYSGAELRRISTRDLVRYTESGVNWRVVEGYGTVIAAHGAALPVALDSAVRRIDHGGRRIRIETASGVVSADQAIITLPTNVLAEDAGLFAPALPAKSEAALGLPLGHDDKLFLSLSNAEEFETESRLFGGADRTATGAYHFRPFGRPLIEAYFGGRLAAELEAGGETAFLDFAVGELTGLLGNAFKERVKPLSVHCWGSDPCARGSYSYAQPGKTDCRAALASPVDDRLFFAGEACSRNDYSTAHGAYLTGIEAADAVIAVRQKPLRQAKRSGP